MAGNFNDHMTEMDEDRLSTISAATTCFGGHYDNPHVNSLRAMRKELNAERRQMVRDFKNLQNASPEVYEDNFPEFDRLRAVFGKKVGEYIAAARNKVGDGLVNDCTLEMVAISVKPMREAWNKTKYFSSLGLMPNFVFKTKDEIIAPVKMPETGTKRPAGDMSTTTDHLATPAFNHPRTSSPKDTASPALPSDGFLRPEGAPSRRRMPEMTPKTETKEEGAGKNADVARWIENNAARNRSPGNPPPVLILDPAAAIAAKEKRHQEEKMKEREYMEKAMQEKIQQAIEATNNAAQKRIESIQQDFHRQLMENQAKVMQAENQVKEIAHQAEQNIERADREREVAAAAAIKIEMQKVRVKESKLDQQLITIAERLKESERKKQEEQAEQLEKFQEAERQLAEVRKETEKLKKQNEKTKDAHKRKSSEKQHPFHAALLPRQAGGETQPKTIDQQPPPGERMESQGKDRSREEYERLQYSITKNMTSFTTPNSRNSTNKQKAKDFETPIGYGRLSQDGFYAMKQLAVNKAKDARPETPFSGGTSIEYALHMSSFDAATDSDALSAKDKLFELTKWFSGPAGKIIAAHNVHQDKESAYALARSELDVFFSQHRDSFAETLKKVKKGKQIHENDYDAHFELYSDLKEAQMMLIASSQAQEFDRRDVLRDILETRLDHMSNSFWKKDEEKMRTTGSPMSFDDLLVQIQRWMTVLNNKGMAHKKPASKIAAISSQASSQATKQTYANRVIESPPKQQPTDRCNICSSIHKTQDCIQLTNVNIEARMNLLSQKGLCFHCFEPGHTARSCSNRQTCSICKKRHATLLHDRKYTSPSKLTANALPFRPMAPSTRDSNAAAAAAASTTPSNNGAIVNPTI